MGVNLRNVECAEEMKPHAPYTPQSEEPVKHWQNVIWLGCLTAKEEATFSMAMSLLGGFI